MVILQKHTAHPLRRHVRVLVVVLVVVAAVLVVAVGRRARRRHAVLRANNI